MITISLYKTLHTVSGTMPLDIELKIAAGEFVSLYGASGVGKTVTLKMIAGLLTPDQGIIQVNEEIWLDTKKKINLKPQKRKIGFVFQEYTLFPNMTVRKNLEYALQKNQDPKIIEELIDLIELKKLEYQKPNTLSGGQQQRVALARALVQKPSILLLDEPLSALDNKMRVKLQEYLGKIHKKYKLTTILVSHNIEEICKLSDRVHVIENNKIARSGTPLELFTPHKVSTNLQLTGKVTSIKTENMEYIVTVLIGTNSVIVVAQESEIQKLKIGDTVMVTSQEFCPVIQRIT